MATNRVFADGYHLSVVVTNPATPVSGDPVRYGVLTGIALTDEAEGGNPAGQTSVDFGPSVWNVRVDDNEGGGIAVGDPIYYHDTATGSPTTHLNNSAAGADAFFGFAKAAVTANATPIIEVLHAPLGLATTTAGAVAAAQIAANSLNGTQAANVADVNVIGGEVLIHRIAAAALTGDVDVVLTHKSRVVDVWCVATAAGGAADTITVKNGANAITDAIDLNVSDKVIVRAATIDDAQHEIAAGGTLRVSGASGVTAVVYVMVIRVA